MRHIAEDSEHSRYDLEAGLRYVADKQAARWEATAAAPPRPDTPGPAAPVLPPPGDPLLDDAAQACVACI